MKKILLLSALLSGVLYGQNIAGDWNGTITTPTLEVRIEVHIVRAADGGLSATMDSVDQGALGLATSSVTFKDSTLRFTVDAAKGTYEGKLGANGSIDGIWKQGGLPYALKLERGTFKTVVHKAAKPSDIDGTWSGELNTSQGLERLVFHIVNTADGLTATLQTQNKKVIAVTSVSRNGLMLKLVIKAINAVYDGIISPDRKSINGTFMQGGTGIMLVLKR